MRGRGGFLHRGEEDTGLQDREPYLADMDRKWTQKLIVQRPPHLINALCKWDDEGAGALTL